MPRIVSLCRALGVVCLFAAHAGAAVPVLVIHGGAGVIRADLTPAKEALVRADLEAALAAGYAVLKAGGSSVDAVARAIVVLEDSPRFNAGKGAVFTHEGTNELDAAIMDGATLRAGAVAAVHRVKNPVLLARAVMERSPHVFLVGDGAEAFARSVGVALVDPAYFRTEERWQQLQKALRDERAPPAGADAPHHGTVGAVALDAHGGLAAATSTGGMTNKRWGRVGDSPLIGAGTYANARCAVSATGWGEYYIRAAAAHDICARVEYAGTPIAEAAREVVMDVIPKLGGDGGVIALDADGDVAMPFNTDGMYRGWIGADGAAHVAIAQDDTRHTSR
ncbi:MAG TPA: isoaspartyl peptidase/L-asparaginase [Dokdonella sp.]